MSRPGDEPPKLLPGITAFAWVRGLQWVLIVTLALFVLVLLAVVFAWSWLGSRILFVEIPLVVLVWVVPLLMRAAPYERRESEAGYTTLPRKHPELPQLDWKTGAVVRAPGAQYVSSKRPSDRSRGDAGGVQTSPPTEAPLPHPSLLRRARATLVGAAITAVFVFLLVWWREDFTQQALDISLILFAGVLFIYLLAYGIGAIVASVRLRDLALAAAADFVFRFRQNRRKDDALAVAMNESAGRPFPRGPWGASASAAGLKLWRGKQPVVAAEFAWSSVTSVQRDSVSIGRTSFPTVLVGLISADGLVSSMQLVWPNADAVPLQSTVETDWVVAKLNALRQARSSATIL